MNKEDLKREIGDLIWKIVKRQSTLRTQLDAIIKELEGDVA